MRRTRHVVLPVRSWQYIGLLLVSLACVTFGLVARDREGQAGSLTGPELLHRAPHDADVCPNLDLFEKPACLDSLEKPYPVSKYNERRIVDSGTVRIERRRSIQSSTSSTRLPEQRLSRSLERMDDRIRNVRFINRKSQNIAAQTYSRRQTRDLADRTRRLSRASNERSRSMDRREEREIERRVPENRELRERRERFEVAARKTIGIRNMEKREIRGNDRFRDMVRSIREKRDSDRDRTHDRRSNSIERRESMLENRKRTHDRRSNSIERRESRLENRERTHDRRSNSIERRESRLENRERTHDRRSNSIERRESRLENRERRLNDERRDNERRNSRLTALNRERRSSSTRNRIERTREIRTNDRRRESVRLTNHRDIERRNSRSEIKDIRSRSLERLESGNRHEDRQKFSILDRRSRLTDRLDSNRLDRERRLSLERRVSLERRASENLDRRSRSLDRRAINGLDRERLLGLERRVQTDRRASENLNRREDQRFNRKQTDLESYRLLDRRSRSLDRQVASGLYRERRVGLERRVSTDRRASENLNRHEGQRLARRTTDLESHRFLDQRSRSLDRRTANGLDRERRLSLERRILAEQASEISNRRENRRELANRLSRSQITINRDSRGEIERTRFARSSDDRQERRKIFLSRGPLKQHSSDSTERREIGTLKRTVRSTALENQNSLRIARFITDQSLARTRNEQTDRTQQRLTRERINDDYRLARSRVNRDLSRQEKRSSRSSEILNRSHSMERRESFENRRARTDTDRRSTVFSAERREIQQRGSIARISSAMLRKDDVRERRNSNARIQERFVRKIDRQTNEQRRFTDSNSISMAERLMELRSRDQRRNVRSNLIMKRNVERRNSVSRIRYTDSRTDLERSLKTIDRSRDNIDRRSSQRRLLDHRQSDSLRDKIRTSEISTRIPNTLVVPSIDRDRSYSARDRSLEKNRRLLDLDRRVQKITQNSRNDDYGRRIDVISSFLKSNTLSNYDSTIEVLRQAFVITVCIVYGLSMSSSKKLFTGNLMNRINRFALR